MKSFYLTIKTDRGTFVSITCGEAENPLMLFLHGFPDNYQTFEALLPKFANKGYYAVSVAIRGFSPSPLTGSLDQDDRVADLFAIADELSPGQQFIAVGQDLSGQTLYRCAAINPERLKAMVVISAPHPNTIKRNALSVKQLWRSRYIILLQLIGIAEWWVARNNYSYIERLWKEWSPGFQFSEERLESVKKTFKESMPYPLLSYRTGNFKMPNTKIKVRTLLLMGEKDGCVPPSISNGQELYFENSYKIVVVKSTGHFLHIEKPNEVFELIFDFVSL